MQGIFKRMTTYKDLPFLQLNFELIYLPGEGLTFTV